MEPEPAPGASPPGRLFRHDPPGASNVAGRRIQSLDDGFGETWDKRFSVHLRAQPSPAEVMRTWKAEFGSFWPEGSRFTSPARGLRPGELAGVELEGPAGGAVSTGVAVDDAGPTSFTLRTPAGHMFAGWIRFLTVKADPGTEARIEMRIRPSDPLYQVGLWLGGNRGEDRFWQRTLSALSARFGESAPVRTRRRRVSRRLTWRNAGNIRDNAGLRTTFARLEGAIGRLLRGRGRNW